MFKSFAFIVLRVRDLEETIEFYTSILGFYLLRKYRMYPEGPESAYVGLDGVLLEIFQLEPSAEPEPVGFGLTVENLDEAMAYLRGRGIEIVRENFEPRTFWGRQAGILDPSGHRISFREWRQPDGPYFMDWQPEREGVTRLA